MHTLDRQDSSHLTGKIKLQWFFTILFLIALPCISCSGAAQQTSSSQRSTRQPAHTVEGASLPLTDSAPAQLDVTPMLPVPQPHDAPTIATPTPTPMLPTSYEAESSQNTLSGGARVISCSGCSGGHRVGDIGLQSDKAYNGILQFNNVSGNSAGYYTMTIYYSEGNPGSRTGYISVNGGPTIAFTGADTGSFSTVEAVSIVVNLNSGENTIKFFNSSAKAPDIDRIVV